MPVIRRPALLLVPILYLAGRISTTPTLGTLAIVEEANQPWVNPLTAQYRNVVGSCL